MRYFYQLYSTFFHKWTLAHNWIIKKKSRMNTIYVCALYSKNTAYEELIHSELIDSKFNIWPILLRRWTFNNHDSWKYARLIFLFYFNKEHMSRRELIATTIHGKQFPGIRFVSDTKVGTQCVTSSFFRIIK